MEESKASVVAVTDSAASSAPPPPPPPPPPSTTTTPPPPPPSAAAGSTVTTTATTKKRPLESDNNDDAHSNYFKMRSVISDLRPYFIEVLQSPDFKNSNASQEIRKQLKVVVKLYENMKADAALLGKSKQDGQSNMDHKTQQEQQPQNMKSPEQVQLEKSSVRPSETKPITPGKVQAEDGQGTYVVGGSAFGWNFITFSGKDAVYYGRTKEEFRSAQVTQ